MTTQLNSCKWLAIKRLARYCVTLPMQGPLIALGMMTLGRKENPHTGFIAQGILTMYYLYYEKLWVQAID